MMLHRWKEWSSSEEVRAVVETKIAEDAKLVAHVTHGIQAGFSSTSGATRRIHRFSLDPVSEFLDVDKARERLQAVRESGSPPLTPRQQVAIDMFLGRREEASEDEERLLAST